MLRTAVFWTHLVCGVAAAAVIVMMSVTGVLLTFERQILAAADRAQYQAPRPGAERLDVDTLLALHAHDFQATSVSYDADPAAAVTLSAGRSGSIQVDAYTGERLPESAPRLRAFFAATTGWHRWFNVRGEGRAAARAITGGSNLVFLFLVLSGLYLWLPKAYRWVAFKAHLKFDRSYPSSKARDYNWHHVIGFWTAIPLAVVVATAVVFSYGWANDLVYRAFGEAPPARPADPIGISAEPSTYTTPLSLDALLTRAMTSGHAWQRITMTLPSKHAGSVSFRLDQGNGGQPQRRHDLLLNAHTGEVHAWQPFQTQSPGRRARSFIRYLHTGEALGWVGQSVAGLVSLTSVLMAWTGLALAYRRLIAPLLRPKRTKRRRAAAS